MNEEQRADFLARAVDDLISGIEPIAVPAALDARDVDAIMQVARNRLHIGRSAANDGLQYEGSVWQRVLEKLDSAGKVMSQGPSAGQSAPYDLSDEAELREMAILRRQMSAQLHAFAETHRDDVWRRVQERVVIAPKKRRIPNFGTLLAGFKTSREGQAYADLLAPSFDSISLGRPSQVGDPNLDEVIGMAWTRKAASQVAAGASDTSRERVWQKVNASISATPPATPGRARTPASAPAWPRALALGSLAVVAIAAIGPLPVTGFAEHPAAQVVRFVGGHIGVAETGTPPNPGGATTSTGTDATADGAAAQFAFDVVEPGTPPGFELASAEVFLTGITSNTGMYAVSFRGAGERTLTVYQERATTATLAAATGSASDVLLADNTPATYFDGRWSTTDGSFSWLLDGTQTLVFDRDGVRTIVVHSGPADAGFLTDFASTLSR